MNDSEAEQILNWLAGNFNVRPDENQRLVWLAGLVEIDAERGSEIANEICRAGSRFPTWPEFRSMVYRRRAVTDESWRDQPPEPLAVPEWVQVWRWLRARDDFRTMPQQTGSPEMTMSEYEIVRQEWEAAGSPTGSFAEIAAMVGA